MANTLEYTDAIHRVGYTVIEGVKVVQHTCTIPLDNPQAMRVGSVRMDAELYKANRDVCRAHLAEFEDAAYQLQDECMAKMTSQSEDM